MNFKIIIYLILRLVLLVSFIYMYYAIISIYKLVANIFISKEAVFAIIPLAIFIILTALIVICIYRIEKSSVINRITKFLFRSALVFCFVMSVLFIYMQCFGSIHDYGNCNSPIRYSLQVELKSNKSFVITDNHDALFFDSYYLGWYKKNDSSISFFQAFPYPCFFKGGIKPKPWNSSDSLNCWCLSNTPYYFNETYLLSLSGFAQDCITMKDRVLNEPDPVVKEEILTDENGERIYVTVNEEPAFPGGNEKFREYIHANLIYPKAAEEQGIFGVVYLSCVIAKDGSVKNAKILRGIGGGCEEEALRLINGMPHWNPAKINQAPVQVQFNLPVTFKLKTKASGL